MRLRRFLGSAYHLLGGLQVLLGVAILLIGYSLKADPVVLRPGSSLWAQITTWIRGGADDLAVLTLSAGLAGLGRRMIGPPWVWSTVHHLLDDFRDDVFTGCDSDPLHHHRVTLFKHVRLHATFRSWPWSGWLMAVERSGHTTRRAISVFKAPDNADYAEGIAGRTWASRGVVSVEDLPDLDANPTDAEYEDYAERTGVSVEWLRDRKPKIRSMCGIPVQVKGRPWGVIVLDSRSPSGINHESATLYRPISQFLGKLLERL